MELASIARRSRSQGAVDIAVGIPGTNPPAIVVEGAISALQRGKHQYADAEGLAELRVAIAHTVVATRGLDIDPDDQLTITCGATEGVFASLIALTNPGDDVLLPEPYYELYPGMIVLVGATPRIVPLRPPDWRLDLTALRDAVTEKTSAIILNTPHNPTGRVFDREEIELIHALCDEFNLACITDEVYEHFIYEGRHLTPAQLPKGLERTVSVSSLSKSLAVTGWRIGFCVADPEVTSAIRRVHERVTLGACSPIQHGLIDFRLDDFTSRGLLLRQRDRMLVGVRNLGLEVYAPAGSWFMLARVSQLGWHSTAFVHGAAEHGVLVAPGTSFFSKRSDGEEWVRMAFVRDLETIDEALDRLEGFLRGGR